MSHKRWITNYFQRNSRLVRSISSYQWKYHISIISQKWLCCIVTRIITRTAFTFSALKSCLVLKKYFVLSFLEQVCWLLIGNFLNTVAPEIKIYTFFCQFSGWGNWTKKLSCVKQITNTMMIASPLDDDSIWFQST